MKADKCLIERSVFIQAQDESELSLNNEIEKVKFFNQLLNSIQIQGSILNDDFSKYEKKILNILFAAAFVAINKYNKDVVIPETFIEVGITERHLKFIDIEIVRKEIIALTYHNNTFAPISFKSILFWVDSYLTLKIFSDILNELDNNGNKRKIKNGKYDDKTTVLMQTFTHINRSYKRGNLAAIDLVNKFKSIFFSDEQYKCIVKNLVHNKNENYIIPNILEDCFLEFKEITNRKKIEIIFPLYLAINSDLRSRMDTENQGDTRKELLDDLYNKIYRRSR